MRAISIRDMRINYAMAMLCAMVAGALLYSAAAGCARDAGLLGGSGAGGGGEWAPEFAVAKWHNDHAAAISVNVDGVPMSISPVEEYALRMGVPLNYEMVSQRYVDAPPAWVEHDLTGLIPDVVPGALMRRHTGAEVEYALGLAERGFGFFGHGHWHVDHDALTYEQAYESFRACYEIMERLGLEPVAYAYPRSAGHRETTQRALADAGFLAGRLANTALGRSPYIDADGEGAPANWFYLPAITMESYDVAECEACVNDTEEFLPILDEAIDNRAWIIPVYHNVAKIAGWGPYRWEHFQGDLRAIAARDFWVARMGDVALYIRERERATVVATAERRNGLTAKIEVTLSDGLDNERFDQPLTVMFAPPPDWEGLPVRITQGGGYVGWALPREGDAEGGTMLASLLPNERAYELRAWYPPQSVVPRDMPNPLLTAYVRARAGWFGEPVARGDFDVYLDDTPGERALIYVREPCAAADTEGEFFLHITPVDGGDLPADARERGYAEAGFGFGERGALADLRCVARVELPGYGIAWVGTGQGGVWEVGFGVDGGR